MERPRLLVADDSRTVRAALVQQLKAAYDVREVADGEAAWHTLVLDPEIRAVVCGRDLARISGEALLSRLRTSKLGRLRNLPFLLLSGDAPPEMTDRLSAAGMAAVIKLPLAGSQAAEAIAHALAASQARAETVGSRLFEDALSGMFTARYLEIQAAQALAQALRHQAPLSVLVIGFDDLGARRASLGDDAMALLVSRFAGVLAGRMRTEDSLAHYGDGAFGIVAPGTSPAQCLAFAERVREAVASGNFVVQGQPVKLTVSIGVAGLPNDEVDVADELLSLANARMHAAMSAGGNRLFDGQSAAPAAPALSLAEALRLAEAGTLEASHPMLPALGLRLMPLLAVLQAASGVTLPLEEMQQVLTGRVQS